VSLTPCGLRQAARSSSRSSPILSRPVALSAIKIASLILRPDRRLVDVTSFQSVRRPSFSFGSSSFISRRRHCFSVSLLRLRPPGNIQSLSLRRLTRRTRPRFEATNFDDLAIFQWPLGIFPQSLSFGVITFETPKSPDGWERVATGAINSAGCSRAAGVARIFRGFWPECCGQ
jgi:hypothetical protein